MTLSSFALLALAATQGSPDEMRLMRFPDVYGDTIVFTYASDLWTVDANGGRATRLTSHAGTEAYAKFSPDGKWIAFTASYDGNPDVYLVSSEGGEPTRLTYNPEPDVVTGWTPDGKVAFRSESGSWGGFMERLWTIDPKGGVPRETPVYEFSQGTFSPDGTKVAYNRSASHQFNWRRYRGGTQGKNRGGTQGKISFLDLKTLAYSELPAGRENSWFPMWVKNEVFFVSDKNLGTVNLYKHDLGSKRTEQLTQYSDADMRWPSTDGKRIVFERDGYLWLCLRAGWLPLALRSRNPNRAQGQRPHRRRQDLRPAPDAATRQPDRLHFALTERQPRGRRGPWRDLQRSRPQWRHPKPPRNGRAPETSTKRQGPETDGRLGLRTATRSLI